MDHIGRSIQKTAQKTGDYSLRKTENVGIFPTARTLELRGKIVTATVIHCFAVIR